MGGGGGYLISLQRSPLPNNLHHKLKHFFSGQTVYNIFSYENRGHWQWCEAQFWELDDYNHPLYREKLRVRTRKYVSLWGICVVSFELVWICQSVSKLRHVRLWIFGISATAVISTVVSLISISKSKISMRNSLRIQSPLKLKPLSQRHDVTVQARNSVSWTTRENQIDSWYYIRR